MHGYEIMHVTKRLGPTVYGVLDKLEDMKWITGQFEDRNLDNPGKPARRFYRLTGEGALDAEQLLHARRPVRSAALPRKLGWVQLVIGVCKLGGAR